MSDLITETEQITPNWISHTLQDAGVIAKNVYVTGLRFDRTEMTNCTVYYLELSYSEDHPAVPQRLFLKLPKPDLDRAGKEVEFYHLILPMMQPTLPEKHPFLPCYSTAFSAETGQAHFLFEDLSATHFMMDELMPPTQRCREQVIDAYALFHAFWWEHPNLGQEIGQFLTGEMIDDFIKTVQKRFSRLVDDMGAELRQTDRSILEAVVTAWPEKRRERVVQGHGITLVHRDPHPRNFLYPRDEQTGMVKLIDWQSWRVDTSTDDLAYLMACHWPLEARTRLEADLLKRYYERLVELGVNDYTWADCCYDYRASIIRCLFFLIMAWSPKQWDRIKRGLEAFKVWHCMEIL